MPAVLHLKLDFAVCEKLCVPDGAEVELELSGAHFAHDAALTASEGRVPVRADLAAPGPLSIVSMRREHRGSRRVIVDVRAPDSSYIDLFVEGPSTDWSLPLPENISGAPPGLHRFAFTLDGLPPGLAPEGAALTLTAVTRSHAVEVIAHLD
jgi:DsbC/DsbD-like thiol-disulfide interchange protein